ncbi:MAG: hypothetical protein F6K38_41700 [Moorea sp. SIO3B2]|nr:hypothetical protein [Moorena sp. SIO3B2]NEP37666.1 hypothetical protein [Moorena sp. SIO3B2]
MSLAPYLIICPGIHDHQLTQDFLASLELSSPSTEKVLIFPAQDYPAYSAIHIKEFLQRHIGLVKTPIVLISFSAGVVGAIAAAWGWQLLGGSIQALIAIDGWGVPLYGNFPIHRISHDYFTHWSSALLGAGEDSFYATPAIGHLDLWRSPCQCQGWWVMVPLGEQPPQRTYITAAEFIMQLLVIYSN